MSAILPYDFKKKVDYWHKTNYEKFFAANMLKGLDIIFVQCKIDYQVLLMHKKIPKFWNIV